MFSISTMPFKTPLRRNKTAVLFVINKPTLHDSVLAFLESALKRSWKVAFSSHEAVTSSPFCRKRNLFPPRDSLNKFPLVTCYRGDGFVTNSQDRRNLLKTEFHPLAPMFVKARVCYARILDPPGLLSDAFLGGKK